MVLDRTFYKLIFKEEVEAAPSYYNIFFLIAFLCEVFIRNIIIRLGINYTCKCRPQWPRALRRRSSAARLLRLWVRIPPGAWMFVCCECCVLPGKGLCDGLITRPGESYRLWRVVLCDQEASKTKRLKPATGL